MGKHFELFAPPDSAANSRAHRMALLVPRGRAESAIIGLAHVIDVYIDHLAGSEDADVFDSVLCPAVGRCISGFRGLLNGDIGRLDGGACDEWACHAALRVHQDPDAL